MVLPLGANTEVGSSTGIRSRTVRWFSVTDALHASGSDSAGGFIVWPVQFEIGFLAERRLWTEDRPRRRSPVAPRHPGTRAPRRAGPEERGRQTRRWHRHRKRMPASS